MNEEQKNKWKIEFHSPKLTPDGYAMVCPQCKDDGELMVFDYGDALADENCPKDVELAMPNMGPGGYYVVSDVTVHSKYQKIDANWRELGIFTCGACGWTGTANHVGKQILSGYSSSSRGHYRDTVGLTVEDGIYWHKVRHLFGYAPYVEGPNDDVEMVVKFEGPRETIEAIWSFLLDTDPHEGFGFPDAVVAKISEMTISEGGL